MKLSSQKSHMPISCHINSTCLHRAVVSLSVLGEIWLLCICYSIRMLHFLAYSSSPPCCWKYVFPAGNGSVILIDNCGDEPWLSTGSWLSGLDIPILHDLRNNTQPLCLKHLKAISRQTCRQEHTSWMLQTLHSIAPLSNTWISSWSERNFQTSQKSVCRVAGWLNRAQGQEELLFWRTIMLVL